MKKLFLIMSVSALLGACAGNDMPKVELPEIDTNNPLLAEWNTPHATPPFDKISISDYEPAFETAIAVSRAEVDAIINNPAKPSFNNTILALEKQGELLDRISSVFFNLLECHTSQEMQEIAMRIQPKLTELGNDVSLNPELFKRVKAVHENPGLFLSKEDKKLLENTYKSFVRSGANLNDADKELYRQYSSELSQLTLQFGQNSLAANNAFSLNITSAKQVAELPDFVKDGLALEAKNRGQKGWTVTLKAPSYIPFVTYSSQRDLKEKLYKARSTCAIGGKFDNTENIRKITALRLKIANLLGYECYADYVLDNRMAEKTEVVNSFLNELLTQTKEYADKDYQTINEYAHSLGFEGDIQPWDWAYYSEKYKNEKYAVSDEAVKPYLELENVKQAVFMLANKLYGLEFKPAEGVAKYHEDVTVYEVSESNGDHLAVLYLDFFPRDSKRAGAWMTEFRGAEGDIRPLVSLVMNFTKPTETTPSLITFDEFTTFLHEFGHACHGMVAKGKHGSLNGTSVFRDFVELPSQILENWAFEKEYLDLWAKHYQTGETMPAELIEKIIAAKNDLGAYAIVRQVSFGMTDMAWHTIKAPYEGSIIEFEKKAMAPSQILPVVEGTAMSPTFGHLFSGGYAAGYYGYKWAEVLAADGYSLFTEKGIFDKATAAKFRKLLQSGGQEHPMDLYVAFRGHKPQTKALIDQMGLNK
ncbi:MAG: M3 family metallopeptidase [Alistipes sp.]|nr:M3 family metallopeptidase [Alistipes sp.]